MNLQVEYYESVTQLEKTFNGSSSPRKNLSDNGLILILLMAAIRFYLDMEREIYAGYIKGKFQGLFCLMECFLGVNFF